MRLKSKEEKNKNKEEIEEFSIESLKDNDCKLKRENLMASLSLKPKVKMVWNWVKNSKIYYKVKYSGLKVKIEIKQHKQDKKGDKEK